MMTSISLIDILRSTASPKIKFRKIVDHIFGSFLAFLFPKPKKQSQAPKNFQSLLIIRPGGIGDAVMLIPFIKALRQEYPKLTIDILCEKRNAKIFQFDTKLINNLIAYDDKGFMEFLRAPKYDVTIDTEQWHILSSLIASQKGKLCSIGFDTRKLRSKLFSLTVPFQKNGYEFENFKALFLPLLNNSHYFNNINASLTVPDHLQQWAQNELNANTVTLFLGGSITIRQLDVAKSAKLIHAITAIGFQPILVGGPLEENQGKAIMNEVVQSNAHSYINKISLQETAALIQRSRLFIGCDSGPLHIAAAVGAPTIGIFGPGNREKWRPRGEGHQIFFNDLPCAPCTRFGYTIPTCHKSYICMKEINITEIITAVEKILNQEQS